MADPNRFIKVGWPGSRLRRDWTLAGLAGL